MSKRARKRPETPGVIDDRSVEKPAEAAVAAKERSTVAQVRSAYRRYLKLGAAQGLRPQRSDTTLDIRKRFSRIFPDDASDALREIYLRARYDGHADREDASRAKALIAQLKKSGQE